MLRDMIGRILESQAVDHGRFVTAYRRFVRPDGHAWARYLKQSGLIYEMGEDCSISPHATITDPSLLRMGNNVRIANATILGHDGSVHMINRAFGLKLDSVGPVTIRDNVFISEGVIILPNVTIGPNVIVGAGSVVVRSVKEGDIVSGVPAKPVGRLEMSVAMLKMRNESLPWRSLIERRQGEFDPALEPELERLRQAHFFGPKP
jgi:acetyltransferase-like isoleucine patch superfamily enzyme